MPLRILGDTTCKDLHVSELPVLKLQLESFLLDACSEPAASWLVRRASKAASWL